jgi:glycosyltransferase involved in cell wall biosynthesis
MAQYDAEDPRVYGFDAAIEFPPHKPGRGLPHALGDLEIVNSDYRGYPVLYDDIVELAKSAPAADYPLFRGVFPSWDNEARKPGAGYTFIDSTPAKYRAWLTASITCARKFPVAGENIVFINAWNEWAEGAYLEPDRRFGYAYLQATREALEGVSETATNASTARLVIVSHDAHPHGAQYLALNMVREFCRMGIPVEAVLLGAGELVSDFQSIAQTTQLDAGSTALQMRQASQALRGRGVVAAIANTTVSGRFVRHLRDAGIEVISLVHELTGVIKEYGLGSAALEIAECASRVVFAADEVRRGFESFAALRPEQALIRPQGLYKRNRIRTDAAVAAARCELRARISVPADAMIVLCVGYADLRKGADYFVAIAARVCSRMANVHFVWVGHRDASIERDIAKRIAHSGCLTQLHFFGKTADTDMFYAGADLYALTSREDPYPSVVLEAFDAGLPVIGFAGVGGLDAAIVDTGGMLAPMGDVDAFAEASITLLADRDRRKQIGAQARSLIEARYAFRTYLLDLLALTSLRRPKVSVIVPNYNYARYLPQRLQSIVEQTLPVYEIIVLDDASGDDSLAVLRELQGTLAVSMHVVVAETNSGSVFRQWQKGVELARGDYVWIAEADDLSDSDFLAGVVPPLLHPSIAMSYSQSQQIDAEGRMVAPDYLGYTADVDGQRWRFAFTASLKQELGYGLAVKNTIPNVSAAVFRRGPLLQALRESIDHICSYRIAGDWLTYLLVLERGDLAYTPRPLNRHRRHGAGVTIGSENLLHLREVMRVQAFIAATYPVADQIKAQARAYAGRLRDQFHLSDADMIAGSGKPENEGTHVDRT